MELESAYPGLFEETPPPPPRHLQEHTLVLSPQIVAIFPQFQCVVNKPHRGLVSTTVNDRGFQTLEDADPESQDWFDDDDVDIAFSDGGSEDLPEPVVQAVEVIVRAGSLVIDGVEFPTRSMVRLVDVVGSEHEDSLVILQDLGFLLLVRLFLVTPQSSEGSDPIFTPFVVQWWDCGSHMNQVLIHQQRTVLVTASRWFRLHLVENTPNGIMLAKHVNMLIPGMILHVAIADTPELVVVLVVWTDHNRCALYLHHDSHTPTMLPLPRVFTVPVLVATIPGTNQFVFVGPASVQVVTPHRILSGDFNLPTTTAPWQDHEFPTLTYIDGDALYVATDGGSVYQLHVLNETVHFHRKIKIPDAILVFLLRQIKGQRYQFIYGSDTDGNKELELDLVDDLADDGYSTAQLRKNWSNWTPIIDVTTIPAYNARGLYCASSQELWALTGTNNRTRLTQFRRGGTLEALVGDESLRKATAIFPVAIGDKMGFVCSLSTSLALVVFDEIATSLTVMEEWEYPVVFAAVVYESLIKVSPTLIVWGMTQVSESVMFAEVWGEYLVVVDAKNQLKLLNLALQQIHCIPTKIEVSCLRTLGTRLFVGGFDGQLLMYTDPEVPPSSQVLPPSPYPDHLYELNNLRSVNDVWAWPDAEGPVFVGTKDGYLYTIDGDNIECYKLSDAPLLFCILGNHLIVTGRSIWMVSSSLKPQRMFFGEERVERSVFTCAPLDNKLVVVRDDAVIVANPLFFPETVIRQVVVGERAAKFVYLEHLHLFLILLRLLNPKNRIKAVDRKLLKSAKVEFKRQLKLRSVFREHEIPICAMVWLVNKGTRVSYKVLVGCQVCSEGAFKVIDVVRYRNEGQVLVTVDELKLVTHNEPITSIQQVEDLLLMVSGKSIYLTSYENGRIHPLELVKMLPSKITLIQQHDHHILVTTEQDLLFQFNYNINGSTISLHTVLKARPPNCFINQAPLGELIVAGDKFHSKLTVFDDNGAGVTRHIQTSCIPRVYPGHFTPCWQQRNQDVVLCVGVSGEISVLHLGEAVAGDSDRQFEGKVSGTGLFALDREEFGWKSNRDMVVTSLLEILLA